MTNVLPIRIDNRIFYLVFFLYILALLWNNQSIGLWDEDEAAYAGFALNMLSSSDWLTIHFDEAEIHRKTPLLFWLIAVFYSIFGVSESILRLPGVLALIGCFMLIRYKSRPWLSEDGAKLAAIIFAGTLSPLILSKIALTDSILLFWGTLAFFSWLELLHEPTWTSRFLMWFSLGMGILTKGPVLLVVVGGVFLMTLIDPSFRSKVWREHPWLGGGLALIPFAIWAYASYTQDYASYVAAESDLPFGEWWQQTSRDHKTYLLPFLWDWYILRRIGGSVLGQSGFPGYHLVCIMVSFLFWLGLLWGMLKWSSQQLRLNKLVRIVIYWLLMSWIFWEFMSSKLPSYSLLSLPALSFLIVLFLQNKSKTDKLYRRIRWLNVSTFTLVSLLSMVAYFLLNEQELLFILLFSISILLIGWVIFYASNRWQHWSWPSINALAFFLLINFFSLPIIDRLAIQSTRNVANEVSKLHQKNPEAEVALYYLDLKQQKMSLYFYLKEKVINYTKLSQQQVKAKLKSGEPLLIITSQQGMYTLHQFGLQSKKIHFRSTDDELKDHSFFLLY